MGWNLTCLCESNQRLWIWVFIGSEIFRKQFHGRSTKNLGANCWKEIWGANLLLQWSPQNCPGLFVVSRASFMLLAPILWEPRKSIKVRLWGLESAYYELYKDYFPVSSEACLSLNLILDEEVGEHGWISFC